MPSCADQRLVRAAVPCKRAADDRFALAAAVALRGIDKVDAVCNGVVNNRIGFFGQHVEHAGELEAAKTECRDLITGSAKFSLNHDILLIHACRVGCCGSF